MHGKFVSFKASPILRGPTLTLKAVSAIFNRQVR